MLRPLIFDLVIAALALLLGMFMGRMASATPLHVAMGTGIETRYETETNTDFASTHGYSELFGKLRWEHWAVVGEFMPSENHDSSSGAYSVRTATSSLGFWARYEFYKSRWYSPYVDLGAGQYFDRTQTQFLGDHDVRNSTRGFISTGGGMTATFWRMMIVDAELRANSVQQRDDFTYSFFVRAGVQI